MQFVSIQPLSTAYPGRGCEGSSLCNKENKLNILLAKVVNLRYAGKRYSCPCSPRQICFSKFESYSKSITSSYNCTGISEAMTANSSKRGKSLVHKKKKKKNWNHWVIIKWVHYSPALQAWYRLKSAFQVANSKRLPFTLTESEIKWVYIVHILIWK